MTSLAPAQTALERAIEQMRHAAPHVVGKCVRAAHQVFLEDPRRIEALLLTARSLNAEELVNTLERVFEQERTRSLNGDRAYDFNRHTALKGALEAARDPSFAAKWEAHRLEVAA